MTIRTGFGRPRKLGMLRQTTISLYEKYGNLYEKASELARREGISFSELLSESLKEYVEDHYPGNPTPPLESFNPDGLKATHLEARFLDRDIRKLIERLNNDKVSISLKKKIRRAELPKKLIRLARLNRKLNGVYSDIIDKAEEILDV